MRAEQPAEVIELSTLEMCAGGGGQALGLHKAGFKHSVLIEIDADACKTLRHNNQKHDLGWGEILCSDLVEFARNEAHKYEGKIDLIAGGVPCPPFSKAGLQLGQEDERDLFPTALEIVAKVKPAAVMLENVQGLLEKKFENYRAHISDTLAGLGYSSEWRLLHASHFGVPQLRPRAILVAIKHDFFHLFEWPKGRPDEKVTVGEALFDLISSKGWEKAAEWKAKANDIAPTLVGGSKKHGGPDLGPTRAKNQWLELGVNAHRVGNEDEIPTKGFVGAIGRDGTVRKGFEELPLLSVPMAAIIQGFPNYWEFSGAKTTAYRQVGNAFPPPVAQAVGEQIYKVIELMKVSDPMELVGKGVIGRFRDDLLKGLIESGTLSFGPMPAKNRKKFGINTIASNADSGNKLSADVAGALLVKLAGKLDIPISEQSEKKAGQTSGNDFEQFCARFVGQSFNALMHIRPGNWIVEKIGGRDEALIGRFAQYAHLAELGRLANEHKELKTFLGDGYTVAPDVVVFRMPLPDEQINEGAKILSEGLSELTLLRAENGANAPLLHASISCKFTMRSDRAQNTRTEALNLIRSRKGRVPNIVSVIAEPLPSRIASLALGTGDVDCVYHIALHELREVLEELGKDDALDTLNMMIEGKRLRDISDLPLDLAI